MNELKAQLQEWRDALAQRVPPAPRWVGGDWSRPGIVLGIVVLVLFPFLFAQSSGFLDATIIEIGRAHV